ncbi:MAG: hypothetical protein ACE5GH_00010 [Fidelibacterota bacterium]
MVSVGDKVEEFTLVDHRERETTVGGGGVKVLFFFPKANTPG